jgi:hypothetical protein
MPHVNVNFVRGKDTNNFSEDSSTRHLYSICLKSLIYIVRVNVVVLDDLFPETDRVSP